MKKFIKLLISFLLITCSIGITTSSTNNKTSDLNEELINSIVDLALEDAEIKIDDYVDVNYFSNLKQSHSILTSHIQKLANNYENDVFNNKNIDELQYNVLTESISNVFNDLSEEEYEVFKTLAEEDPDISNMLDLVESDFNDDNINSTTKTSNVITLAAGVATIGTILSAQQVCSTAIVTIKGAFNSMVATLKAFFVPNSLKSVIVTASILVISTVVIINWNKIKPVFNKIINVFVDNAKKLATTVTKVFNSIYQKAAKSESTNKDVQEKLIMF